MFSKQYTPLKITLYSILAVVCFLLQSVPALKVRFMGNPPELLLVLTIAVAYFESADFSAFFGLFTGLLSDVVTDTIVGPCAILFMFIGFFVSLLLKTLLRGFFLTYIFITLSALTLQLTSEYLLGLMLHGGLPFFTALIKVILPKLLFSGVLAYPVYWLIKYMNDKLWSGGENAR